MTTESTNPPLDRLYIYEVVGLTDPLEPGQRPGFIGCWLEGATAYLFFDRPAPEVAAALAGGRPVSAAYEMSYLDWQGEAVSTVQKLGRFTVRPPWLDADTKADSVELIIDPGVVFGAGNHPTTTHCLAALERIAALGEVPAQVLDLGCGTGILALAALKLDVKQATAVDLNPLCCQVTGRNAELNQLTDRLEIIHGDAVALARRPGGLVLANLQAEVLDRLAEAGGFENRDWLVLSGITRSHRAAAADLAYRAGYELVEEYVAESTWFSFLFRRRTVTS